MAHNTLDNIGGVLGAAGDAIGLIGSLVDALFPPAPPDEINNFRLFAGLVRLEDPEKDTRSTGGNAPSLAVWDAIGGFVGQSTPQPDKKIEGGHFHDYSIEGGGGVDYLSVVQNGNDGICVSLITGQSAGDGPKYLWSGDMGKECGAPWYQQRKIVGNIGNTGFAPACVWIDGNGDNGHNWQGFNFHLNSFHVATNTGDVNDTSSVAAAWTANKDLLCKSEPRFSLYEDIKIGNQVRVFKKDPTTVADASSQEYADRTLKDENWAWGDKPPTASLPTLNNGKGFKIACVEDDCPPKGPSFNQNLKIAPETRRKLRPRKPSNLDHGVMRASIKKRQEIHADHLIISNMVPHSAAELCDSMTSLGPDFVSTNEMLFCDMSEKQIWPVCTDPSGNYCFDMDTQTVRGSSTGLKTSDVPLYNNGTSFNGTHSLAQHPSVPVKAYTTVNTWD